MTTSGAEALQQFGISAKLPDVFDHSFTGTYEECNRMALYERIWGRKSRYGDDYSLVWGGVFHKCAEVWLKTGDLSAVIEVIDLNLEEDIDDRYGRNKLRMQEAFIEWVKFRKTDPIEIIRTEQPAVVYCQGPCPYSADGCNLMYGGKLDQIVRWNSLVGPLDIKTTVMDTSDPIVEYKPNHQMEGYTWLTTHLMGKPCWGAIVERMVINKSKIKPHRFPVPFPKDEILEWVETERLIHVEIKEKFQLHAFNEIEWRQNKARCALPYLCKYRDLCLSPRDANFRLRWIRDNTTEDRFDFRANKEGARA